MSLGLQAAMLPIDPPLLVNPVKSLWSKRRLGLGTLDSLGLKVSALPLIHAASCISTLKLIAWLTFWNEIEKSNF